VSITDILSQPQYRSTKGRVPVFRPTLNGEEFVVTFTNAKVALSEKQHDVAIVSCTSTVLTTTDGLIDQPFSFYYGQAPRTELFCGYIVAATVDQSGQGILTFTMIVLGPTKVMQEGKPRFWLNKSAAGVVQNLAYTSLLGYTGHADTHLWRTFSQTDESDWTACLNAAARLGWSIYSRYGVVMCYDPAVQIRENGSYATLMSSQDVDFDVTADRRLIEFTPQETSSEEPKSFGRRIAYFGAEGQVLTASQLGDFKQYMFLTGFVIDSTEDAQVYTNAPLSNPDNWNQSATARIWGDSDIYPGMCIDVVTTNTAYLRSKFDGRWLVRQVQHTMDTQQYQTMLTLARPDNKVQVSQAAYVPFWQEPQTTFKARPGLFIQDGGWVSTVTDPRVRDTL